VRRGHDVTVLPALMTVEDFCETAQRVGPDGVAIAAERQFAASGDGGRVPWRIADVRTWIEQGRKPTGSGPEIDARPS
jgi:hypothetical protein